MKEVEREPREYMVSEPKSVSKRQKCFIIFESAGRPRKIRIHKCPLDVEGNMMTSLRMVCMEGRGGSHIVGAEE